MVLVRAIPDEVIEKEQPAAIAVPLARLDRLSSRRDTGGRPIAQPLASAVMMVRDGERFLVRRVRVVRHDDGGSRGMSAARTLGVGAARGELIGFVDADALASFPAGLLGRRRTCRDRRKRRQASRGGRR